MNGQTTTLKWKRNETVKFYNGRKFYVTRTVYCILQTGYGLPPAISTGIVRNVQAWRTELDPWGDLGIMVSAPKSYGQIGYYSRDSYVIKLPKGFYPENAEVPF